MQCIKKRKRINNVISKFISHILFSFRSIVYFSFKRTFFTRKPPKILIDANDIAKNPKILEVLNIVSEFPANPAIIAPTIMTDEIALVTDIKGV